MNQKRENLSKIVIFLKNYEVEGCCRIASQSVGVGLQATFRALRSAGHLENVPLASFYMVTK